MKSILRNFATIPSKPNPPQVRYDKERQMSQILENGKWTDSWDAISLMGSKKSDIETGEDSKGE